MENPSKKRSFDIKKPYKTETFIFPLKKSEAFPPPTSLISTTKNKPKTTLLLQDSIITSIARENMKNFLHYKMWKKKTSTETLNSPINNIETLPNLQNSLKKTISLKKAPENNHIMTKSLTNLNFKEKNGLAKTFSSSFQRNLDEKERKKQNKGRKMIKLAQIVTKVRNFKLNYPEKGSKTLEALLESVKSLNPSENPFKTLEKIDSPPLKRPLSISSDKKPLKFLHKQRKSLDINLKVLRPEKAIPLLPKTDFLYYMTLLDYFIRNPNDSDYFNLLYREHFLQSLAAYNYCIGLKEKAQKPFFEGKKVFLGPNPRNLKTLIFDLDETLVHCNELLEVKSDIQIKVKISEKETIEAGINIRPFCKELLQDLQADFEIVVFTASHSSYANTVLDHLDPAKSLIKARLYREHCVSTEQGIFIKDLRVFGDRKLENMVLIDNALYSFGFQIENGIPIVPFYDNKQDKELLSLKGYLEGLPFVEDLRDFNRKNFKFSYYDRFENIEGLLECLFKGLEFQL